MIFERFWVIFWGLADFWEGLAHFFGDWLIFGRVWLIFGGDWLKISRHWPISPNYWLIFYRYWLFFQLPPKNDHKKSRALLLDFLISYQINGHRHRLGLGQYSRGHLVFHLMRQYRYLHQHVLP